jgi:hypothetical protein
MPKPLPPHPNVCKCTHIKVSGQHTDRREERKKRPLRRRSLPGQRATDGARSPRLRPQYLIEHPEFGPPSNPGARAPPPARPRQPSSEKPKPSHEPQSKTRRRKAQRQTQPRSGERTQPTAQAVGQKPKTIQRRRSERPDLKTCLRSTNI